MSVWADIHRRSTGEQIRKEDGSAYYTLAEITEMVKRYQEDLIREEKKLKKLYRKINRLIMVNEHLG